MFVIEAPVGQYHVWNERANQWQGPFALGNVIFQSGRNVVLAQAVASGLVTGYSVQRGDWVPGPPPAGPATVPVVEENVGWFEDGAMIHGFASSNEMHSWRQWPNGTEYQVLSGGNTPPTTFDVALYGQAVNMGTPAFLFYGVAPFFPGMGVGGIAGLYHLPGPAPVIPMGNVDFRGLAKLKVPLPMGGPVCLQLWLEGLYVNLGFPTFADPQPEPAWFF